jgi:hypothetical protein
MYVFVRFTGIAIVVFGSLLMLAGFVGAIYGFVQNDAVVDLVNNYIFANSRYVLPQQDIRFYTTFYGLALFLLGMITSALGQLMLVFADIATNSRETIILLRSLRRRGL